MTNLNDSQPENSTPPTPQTAIRYEFPAQKPYVTSALLIITILAFLLQQASQYYLNTDLMVVLFAKVNEAIDAGQVWRLITPILVHGDLMHIGFNMYALVVIGQRLEQIYGHWRFLGLYFISAIAGNIVSYYLTPNASIGASTAIFGLLAADGVFIFINRRYFSNAKRSLINLAIILAFNLFYGLSVPSIDLWGHLGGLLGGLSFAWFAGPFIKVHSSGNEIKLVDEHLNKKAITTSIIHFTVLAALVIFKIATA